MRKIGVDLNLQERLDEMFSKEQSEEVTNAIDIGFPVGKLSKYFSNLQLKTSKLFVVRANQR